MDLCRLNKTKLAEVNSSSSKRRSATSKSTQEAQSLNEIRPEAEPLIDTASLENFITPRIRYTHGFESDADCILDVPPTRSMYLYSGNASFGTPEYVMVEWRSQQAESAYSQISKEVMEVRRKHLVGILHQTAITDNDFRVMDCLRYTLTEGRLPNGKSHPLIGFVLSPTTMVTKIHCACHFTRDH